MAVRESRVFQREGTGWQISSGTEVLLIVTKTVLGISLLNLTWIYAQEHSVCIPLIHLGLCVFIHI